MTCARVVLTCEDLASTLTWFQEVLGFRLETIAPADDPRSALLSGHGLMLSLERDASRSPDTTTLRLPREAAQGYDVLQALDHLNAPNGTRIEFLRAAPAVPFSPRVQISDDSAPWITGRAGMQYRDLVPDRQGGALIASHIRIPGDGPVPDAVHFHDVDFQLIYCLCGRVRLAYQDQGEPFELGSGDCVLQPPGIRHRVLEASGGLEVLEITAPAEHATHLDHELELPTPSLNPTRLFGGQRFVRHLAGKAAWKAHRVSGVDQQDCGIADATGGRAEVLVLRVRDVEAARGAWPETDTLEFFFIRSGSATFVVDGSETPALKTGDALTIPGGSPRGLAAASADLVLLVVRPGLQASGPPAV